MYSSELIMEAFLLLSVLELGYVD